MSKRMATQENWSAEVTLLAADATKTLLAARTGRRIVVTHLVCHQIVSAAQAVNITIGTVTVKRIGVSEAVGSEGFIGPMERGLVGDISTALLIVPTVAGPSVHVVAEGYYE